MAPRGCFENGKKYQRVKFTVELLRTTRDRREGVIHVLMCEQSSGVVLPAVKRGEGPGLMAPYLYERLDKLLEEA